METPLEPDISTTELVREALFEVRALFKTEMQLARDELRREAAKAGTMALAMGLALGLFTLAVGVFLVAFALLIFPRPLPALIVGAVLLLAAAGAALYGYRARPQKPLHDMRERLRTDVQALAGEPPTVTAEVR